MVGRLCPVASLGLVSPVAATDGVTLIFPERKLTTFLVIAVCKVMIFFWLPDLVCPLLFLNSATRFFLFPSGVTPPLEGVTRGGPLPPSDATGFVSVRFRGKAEPEKPGRPTRTEITECV